MFIGGLLCGFALLLLGIALEWQYVAPLVQYVATPAGGQVAVATMFLLVAVMWMNGLSRTDLLLAHRSPEWYRKHWMLSKFHHINSEGEMAGVILGGIVLWYLLSGDGLPEGFHWPITEAFTLFGIMSCAILVIPKLQLLLGVLERAGGIYGVVFGTSMASAVTGEPAAAVILSSYLRPRVKDEYRAKVASGIAATIGSGGGWLPFAAPPILIIWPLLSSQFHWSILTLLKYAFVGCALHAALVTWRVIKAIEPSETLQEVKSEPITFQSMRGPLALLALVGFHIIVTVVEASAHHDGAHHGPSLLVKMLWCVDGVIGLANLIVTRNNYQKRIQESESRQPNSAEKMAEHEHDLEELREEAFAFVWQPLILGLLLVALEIIGVAGQAAPMALGQLIPEDWSPFSIMTALFFMTAVTSHFADNALASRVYIVIAVGLRAKYGEVMGDLTAVSIIFGALFGGFLTIPANLPNFAIARNMSVSPGAWIAGALRWYASVPAYLLVMYLLTLIYL